MNNTPKQPILRQALRKARTALTRDPNGVLPLPQRRRVWLAMGVPHEDALRQRPLGLGWRRRVRLSLLTVEHLLPLWERAFPGDAEPREMLFLARQVFIGVADPEAASADAVSYWNAVANLGATENGGTPPDTAFMVGCAAARVMQTVCYDAQVEFFEDPAMPDWEELDREELDTDGDAWMWDESYLGAMAAAGGDAWSTTSSPTRRREFWLWWLGYAVPQACKLKITI